MGLIDFLFGKKDNTQTTVSTNSSRQYGHIITEKADVTLDHYSDICESFIALDTETTGLSSSEDVIIEVGAVKFVGNKIVASYNSLVNESVTVPYSAYQVNHISTSMIRQQGKAPDVVYHELTNFMGDALCGKIYVCAHNASFDMDFLKKTLEYHGYHAKILYIDTLSLSKQLIRGLSNYKQDTVAKYFGINNTQSHRADSDAEVCGKILTNLLLLKQKEFEKEKIQREKHIPTDEDKEIIAIIANSLKDNGCDIRNLRAYRNSSNYVVLIDKYIILRFKVLKKKSFLVIPKLYIRGSGISKIEDCTNTEGTSNIRVLFDDPFELIEYGYLLSELFTNMNDSQGAFMNDYETEYFANTPLTYFTDLELKEYLESAKNRQKLNAEKREQENQKRLEQKKREEADKAEKLRIQKEAEKKKQEIYDKKIRQQELLKNLIENTKDISEAEISEIAKLSASSGKRAVIQLNDNGAILRIYQSVSEASNYVGVSPKTIRDVANGKYKHGGGFCWKYADQLYDKESIKY